MREMKQTQVTQALGGYLYSDDDLLNRHDKSLEFLEHVPQELPTPNSTLLVLPPWLIGDRHFVQHPPMLLMAVKLLQRQWIRDFFVTSYLPPGIFVFQRPSLRSKQLQDSETGGKWSFDLSCEPVKAEECESLITQKNYPPILTARGSGTSRNTSLKGMSIGFTARTELVYSLSNKNESVVSTMDITTRLETEVTDGCSPITRLTPRHATFSGKHGKGSPKQTWISEPLISFGTSGVEKHGS